MQTRQARRQGRHRRFRAIGVSLGILLLLATFVALPVVAWAMGIVAEAQHALMERIPQNNPGTYLLTEQGALPLYDWYMPMTRLPPDAASLEVQSLRILVVATRRSHSSQAYILYDLGRQAPLTWQSSRQEGRQLFLQPPPLQAGDYLLIVPTEDLLGGNTYHYFRLY
jgi:hypothetical protein